jgi:hypothetical protein
LTIRISDVASVAHQPAGLGIFTPRIGRGHRKAHSLKLEAPGVEEGIAADEEGVGSLARKGREGPFDLAVCAGVEDLDLQSLGAGSRFRVFNVISVFLALSGLTSTATRVAAGTNSCRSSSRFAANSGSRN